ncbi:hypothetical protein CEXT_210401 [Caerostris extrusa]|uniref:Uncharacterized protein n=1 Tax=Caerostris extrusa TaxID=172846 RepID=A0AAV4UPN7_CAEEX|nr:hypothetical protein CEXT_210401 [Caerostris extrusa]
MEQKFFRATEQCEAFRGNRFKIRVISTTRTRVFDKILISFHPLRPRFASVHPTKMLIRIEEQGALTNHRSVRSADFFEVQTMFDTTEAPMSGTILIFKMWLQLREFVKCLFRRIEKKE